jgi:hypothetical protein
VNVAFKPSAFALSPMSFRTKRSGESVMSLSNSLIEVDTVSSPNTTAALFSSIRSLAQRITRWASACSDYHAAATFYEHLSGLSDVELRNRELSRDTLARDLSLSWREFA